MYYYYILLLLLLYIIIIYRAISKNYPSVKWRIPDTILRQFFLYQNLIWSVVFELLKEVVNVWRVEYKMQARVARFTVRRGCLRGAPAAFTCALPTYPQLRIHTFSFSLSLSLCLSLSLPHSLSLSLTHLLTHFKSLLFLLKLLYLIIRDLAQVIKKLKRKWHKSQRAVVGAQRSNNTSFFFQY